VHLQVWSCRLVPRKQVSFVILLAQLGLQGFSRVSKVKVGINVSVGVRTSIRDVSEVMCRVPDV